MLLKIRRYVPYSIKRLVSRCFIKAKFKHTDVNSTNFFQLWDVLTNKIFIGEYTYIGRNWYFFCKDNRISIWKYCSIAENVYMITYNHSMKYISSHINQYNKKIKLNHTYKQWDILIWNDVRIWHNCIVLPWVTIWNGAIIWAWSVVTKDVPAYAVVWWNPARIIKYRFSKKSIEFIENLKWQNRTIEDIKKNENLFNKKFE